MLKKLHQPFLKYVMLLHSVLSSHAFWHCSRVKRVPPALTSPAVESHALLGPSWTHASVNAAEVHVVNVGRR